MANITPAELYEMTLHEVRDIRDGKVMRVPGGWIYMITSQGQKHHTFVPWSEDLKPE